MPEVTTAVIREPSDLDPVGLTVEISPLTIKEDFRCDQLLGEIVGDKFTQAALMLSQTKVRAICSIRKINGEPVVPLGSLNAYEAVAQRFTLQELGEKLTVEYAKSQGISVPDLKNE